MKVDIKLPSIKEAEAMIEEASEQNPGPWIDHSKVVARIAKTIARKSGLDENVAYIAGLLHDIGRYEGVRGLHHIYAGYQRMKDKGYNFLADICLSHSFPYQNLEAYGGGELDCTEEEIQVIRNYLSETTFNDYDKLIQLCDAMALSSGVCIIDVRIVDIVRRYGFDDCTLKKWDSIFLLQDYFDMKSGMNIYDLFYDEIRDISFR